MSRKKAKVFSVDTNEISEEDYVVKEEKKKTTEYMSIFEYTALINARAVQLGAPGEFPLVDLDKNIESDFDPANIAVREIREGVVSFIIRRKLVDGTTEDWNVKDMIFPRV